MVPRGTVAEFESKSTWGLDVHSERSAFLVPLGSTVSRCMPQYIWSNYCRIGWPDATIHFHSSQFPVASPQIYTRMRPGLRRYPPTVVPSAAEARSTSVFAAHPAFQQLRDDIGRERAITIKFRGCCKLGEGKGYG